MNLVNLKKTAHLLAEKIESNWKEMPAATSADLSYLFHEQGECAVSRFLGVVPLDVRREGVEIGTGFPLLYMSRLSVTSYLGAFLLVFLDLVKSAVVVPVYIEAMFRAHLFGVLSDYDFLKDSLCGHITQEQWSCVQAFVDFCVENKEPLGLDDKECAQLTDACEKLSGVDGTE